MSISKMIICSSSLVAIIAGIAGIVAYDCFSELEASILVVENWQADLDQLRKTILLTCFAIFLIALVCGQFIARFLNKAIADLSSLANDIDGEKNGTKTQEVAKLNHLAKALRQSQIISSQKKQMETLNKELQLKNDSLDSLVYRVSHDLKAPIINIQSLLSIITNRVDEKDILVTQSLGMAKKSTLKLQTTIVDFLEVSRIEKRLETKNEWLSIFGIISDVLADNQAQINTQGILFDIDLGPVNQLYFSKNNLSSVLGNLITNAIKYSSPDRDSMIRIYTHKQEDRTVILTIEDNGIGIDMEKHGKNLFKMFKRFHDHVEGTGVGMYIVKKLLEENNSSIQIESEVNVGTKLTLSFQQSADTPVADQSIALS